jgi:hypothetical protein
MKFKEQIKILREGDRPNKEYAIGYAIMGFYIIPLHYVTDKKKCSCGNGKCSSPGKHPIGSLVPKGLTNASKDSKIILEWFDKFPLANVAIVTGKISRITVLDFDVKGGGVDLFNDLRENHGEIDRCYIARTGGDGYHCVFKYSGVYRTMASAKPGVDIRNDGGYIVVEPSNHISGGEYRWIL